MSLLHDAIKAKQREFAERSQSEEKQNLVVQGFLPYVTSGSPRRRSPSSPAVMIVAASAVFLAVTAWVMRPRTTPSRPTRAPIILPPPVTVTRTPSVVDTGKVTRPDTKTPAEESVATTPFATTESSGASSTPAESRLAIVATEAKTGSEIVPADSTTRKVAAPAGPIRPERPRIDYEGQATVLFNAGDLAGAREKFALATRFAPNARAWTNYGVTLQRLGDLSGAAAAYRSAVALDPNYLEAWLYQGRVAAEQGDLARAVPLFQRALSINPRNADVNVELSRLEYESHNWTEARRFAEAALRGDATNMRAYWFLAVASDPLKDVDAAIRGYTGYLRYVGDAPDQARFVGWARTRLAELRVKP